MDDGILMTKSTSNMELLQLITKITISNGILSIDFDPGSHRFFGR